MHLLLPRCSGRVRSDSAHSAHDTILSDANAARSQDLAPRRVRRGHAAPSLLCARKRSPVVLSSSCPQGPIFEVLYSSSRNVKPRGGRASAGGRFSEWRCVLARTDRSSHRPPPRVRMKGFLDGDTEYVFEHSCHGSVSKCMVSFFCFWNHCKTCFFFDHQPIFFGIQKKFMSKKQEHPRWKRKLQDENPR